MSEYYVELGPFINPVPEVTEADNGMFLGVESGEWTKVAAPSGGGGLTSAIEFVGEYSSQLRLYGKSTVLSYNDVIGILNSGKVVMFKDEMYGATIILPLTSCLIDNTYNVEFGSHIFTADTTTDPLSTDNETLL